MIGRLRILASSYRVRLALGYALVVVVLAGAWAWSLYGPVTQVVVEQQRSHLETIAQASALAFSQSRAVPAQEVRQLVARTNLRVTVVAPDGTVVADSAQDPAKMENHRRRPEIAAALAGHVGFDTRTSATLGVPQMYVAVPMILDGGSAALRVSEPLARIEELASRARQTGLLLLLGAIAAALVVGYRLSASAAQPVVRLKESAETMARGDLRSPVPDVGGELGGLAVALTTLRDTMRTTIGELESGQATLRTVLDGLQAAVFLFDGEIVALANSAASTMFRAPGAGWRGTHLSESGLPASLASEIGHSLPSRSSRVAEIGPDPERRYLRVTTVPLDPLDAGPRTLVVVEDVTGARRLDQVRRDFVANASHELKTPASAIQLLAESADAAAADGDTEQALMFASQIKEEAVRLRRLVVELLDLSRLETAPEPGTIADVRAAVGNALAAHAPVARATGLTLAFDDAAVASQDVYAAADPTDVAVILDNLLANALAYTDDGGATVVLGADDDAIDTDGQGHRRRHPRRASLPRVRALLSGRRGPHARERRHRARPRAGPQRGGTCRRSRGHHV